MVTITLDWKELHDCLTSEPAKGLGNRISTRISEDNAVDIHVTHFNFINYTISYKVDETVVESYVTLEKLWSQLLGLPFLGGIIGAADVPPAPCTDFKTCLARWALRIATTNIQLGKFMAEGADKTYLDDAGQKAVADHANTLKTQQGLIQSDLDRVMANAPTTAADVAQFEDIYAKQEKLFEKLDAYAASAALVANGKVLHIGKKKAGTIVSVSLTPKNSSQGDATPVVTTEYFVHSKLPVVFHAGYVYANLNQVKFETVRSLSQTDLFSAVKTNDSGIAAMAAFLSLGRSFMHDEKVGLYFSVGTDFASPGDRLYLGPSVQLFKRLFFTVGLASGKTEQGVNNPVIEKVGDTLQARELFTAIETHRQWNKAFYGVSFRVF